MDGNETRYKVNLTFYENRSWSKFMVPILQLSFQDPMNEIRNGATGAPAFTRVVNTERVVLKVI